MLTNKVILTYKRKRFSVHSDHGVQGGRASNAPMVADPVNLDEDRTNNVEFSVADSISNKKQFTLKDYSCTKSGPELVSHGVKEKTECQLPDLNMTGSPSSVHLSRSPDRNCCAEFPEKAIVTQVISGKADNRNTLLPETGSCAGFSGETMVKEIASTYTGSSSEVNVNIARSEAVPKVTPLITFTRRTKMKNHLDKTYNDTVAGDVKNVIYKPIKDEQEDNKKGLFYRRREKLLHTSEKDMVDYIEDGPGQHSQKLLQTENVANAGNNLERSAAPCEVSENMDLQLSDHSELVECDKEERHDKLKSMWSSTSIPNNIDHGGVTRSKQNDIGNTVEMNTVLDSSHNMDSHMILEQLVATSAVENTVPAANTVEKIGGSQWLKLPLETSQLSQRKGTSCSSTREGGSNNRQDHRFQTSTLSHAKLDWSMPYELEHRLKTQNTAKFQERMFISNFPDGRQEIPRYMEKSSICTNFLGLATSHIDPTSSSITNLGSMAKPLGLHNKENPDSRFLFGNSQLRSKSQVVDNIISGTRMLNQRQGLSLGFRKHPSNWSDEELDSLWIGVRRHGRNNWNAMLRDPRLYFQDGRTPKDLVERWELEQARLFSSIQFPSLNLGPRAADTMIESLSSDFQASRTETQLSLGNAYLQKSDNYMNRKLFQSPPDPRASSSTVGSVSYLTYDYPKKSFWKANARNQKQAHVHRPSALERTTSVRTNVLPHWLKEVVGAPPLRPSDLPLQPAFDPRRGILKRNMASTGLNYAESPLVNEALAGGKNLFDLNRNSPEQGHNRNDLVIIESDVSSEETISDDGRG